MNKYELTLEENSDGDLYFTLPQEVLSRLDWQEGDEIKFIEKDKGFLLKKIRYESIELDFTEEELYKYMLEAHQNKMSLDEWIQHILEKVLKEEKVSEWQQNMYRQDDTK